jgi:hypothetical protein
MLVYLLSNDPKDWLITFDDYNVKDGRPFGDGTKMAKRIITHENPWDEECKAETIINGKDVMTSVKREFTEAISAANDELRRDTSKRKFIDDLGHVYISDWHFNPNRDISGNSNESSTPVQDTAWYWICQLMNGGIRVRMLLWLPLTTCCTYIHR